MITTTKLLLKLVAGSVLALMVAAGAVARDYAVVIKTTGDARVVLPGDTAPRSLTKDMQVPKNARITTGANGEVFLEVMVGVVAALKPNTVVVVEENTTRVEAGQNVNDATLDVRGGGGLVSTLNPAMTKVNRYKVRTPLGVAAARGTVFSIRVAPGTSTTTVGTMSGTVVLTVDAPGGGTREISIPYGTAISTGGAQAAALAQELAQNPGLAQDIADAVKIVADNVKAPTSAVDSADAATAILATVVSAAAGALPAQAASFVEIAIAAAVSNTSATGKSASATNAVTSAITEAAVKAAPGQAQAIVSKAAETIIEVKVTEAVSQARASGGDANAAAALATTQAQATLQSIAQGAGNAMGTGDAGAIGRISEAVNTGANTGSSNAAASTNTVKPPTPGLTTPPAVATPAPLTTPPINIDARSVSPSGGD